MFLPLPSHYQSGVTFSGFGFPTATALMTHPLPTTTLTNQTLSDSTHPSDDGKKPAAKKRAPPAAAVGDVTPPRAVVVLTGNGSAGNPIEITSIDREEVTVRRGRRALLLRGSDYRLPSTTSPVAAVPAFLAAHLGSTVKRLSGAASP
jgi:hypothetical protein